MDLSQQRVLYTSIPYRSLSLSDRSKSDAVRASEHVLSFLNGQERGLSKASNTRVSELIDGFSKALPAMNIVIANKLKGRDEDARADATLDKLEDMLKQYPAAPSLVLGFLEDGGGWAFTQAHIGPHPEQESVLAWQVIEIAKAGYIHRFRRCICGKWFFATRENQTACSEQCRHKKYERTDTFRARRRDYMRWYYAMYQSPKATKKKITFEQWLKQRPRKAR